MQESKGFTIIELLVVITIIAVLVGIVLVNVVDWINVSKDASIQANLSSIGTNGSVYFETNLNYTDFCTSTEITNSETAITGAGGTPEHNCTDTTWCACSTLKVTSGHVFCVDYTGYKKETTNDCVTACPAAGECV